MADKLKPVKITWKEDEVWLHDFAYEHSSPAAWFKDLAIAEYKRKKEPETPKQNQGLFNMLDD